MGMADNLNLKKPMTGMANAIGPGASFDTPLSSQQEALFQLWKQQFAPMDSGTDYDLRGAFLAGLLPSPQNGHWPDTFKKPNHPTFSVESKYAPSTPWQAGHWLEDVYVPPYGGNARK